TAYYDHANALAVGRTAMVSVGRVPPAGTFGPITFTNGPGWEMFIAAVQFPPPRLDITGGPTGVVLQWPTVPSGYVLRTTTALLGGDGWQDSSSTPFVTSGANYLSLQPANAQQFFRLKRNDN